MHCLLRCRWLGLVSQNTATKRVFRGLCSTAFQNQVPEELREVCRVVSISIGGLDDLECSLNRFTISLSSPLVRKIIDCCKDEAPTRRLLRFFLWSRRNFDAKDEDFNHILRVLAEKKDLKAVEILISDMGKEGGVMETQTFLVVAEALVKLGREDEALGLFKNLEKFKCPQDSVTVSAIVTSLCAKGHAKKAQGVVWHHKDKISGTMPCIYRSLVYGWSVQENAKELRKVIKEMKGDGLSPDLFCFNTLIKCICEKNAKVHPSGLVPDTLNVMMEMRTHGVQPNTISYNILLSCLGRTRRVKESVKVLEWMKRSGCAPDWHSYYLVVKVMYLTGRFGKGNELVDEMFSEGLKPIHKFYSDLIGILCGVERPNFALELFERMKQNSLGGYGPVYDVLIPKLCRGGDFEKGRELWDEAVNMGITLSCSEDVLDPSITEVFIPKRKEQELVSLKHCTPPPSPPRRPAQFKKFSSARKSKKELEKTARTMKKAKKSAA
ncbi:Pentatricopeptide repeat-containing protein At5g61370, mitochondrial [Linum perenne]